MDRRFVMPAASALALCVTNTACTNLEKQFVGNWLGVTFDDGVDFYNLPYSYSDTEDGITYTYTGNFFLQVQEDGRAAFGSYYEYSSSEGASDRDEYLASGDWERGSGREFLLSIAQDGDADDLDMNCTLEAGNDDLTCNFQLSFFSYSYSGGSYSLEEETRDVILELRRDLE